MEIDIENPIEFLEESSYRIVKIAIPVVLTLICDAILTRVIENTHGSVSLDRSFSETLSYNTGGLSTMWAIIIAVIFIVAIIIVTAILLVCYFYGYTKVLFVWMVVAVTLILSYYVWSILGQIPELLNFPVDYIALVLFIINLVVIGDLSIFWRAPPIVTQAFLIFISILVALVFLTFPDWTIWILLAILVVYDCCVVLCPHGLLNMLIKKSEERNDEIPALVYASAAYNRKEYYSEDETNNEDDELNEENEIDDVDPPNQGDNTQENDDPQPAPAATDPNTTNPSLGEDTSNQTATPIESKDDSEKPKTEKKKKKSNKKERDGVRLGLGDFCFYGVLITRAARLGWDLTILCIFAVILGLSLTLLLLAWLKRPLPALPISLILGILFFCIGALTFRKFSINLMNDMLAF